MQCSADHSNSSSFPSAFLGTAIIILATKHSPKGIVTICEFISPKSYNVHGKIDKKVLNVFDENIRKLEKLQGEESISVEFENNDVVIKSSSLKLEGNAEEVVIKKLYDSNMLIFKNEDMSEGVELIRDFTRVREAKRFADEYLTRDYGKNHINILRIIDSIAGGGV